MSVIISGDNGISDVDGSAGTPAIRGTDANTGIFFGSDIIGFSEGGTECARFNADAQFVAAAGTASLPVITTTGDVNTGIFFPAADTIAFAEGGAEAMRINSSGNVGIGTSSPVTQLQVGASSDVGIAMSNSSSVTSGNRGTIYVYNSDVSTVGYIRFGAVTDNVGTDIQFGTRPAGGSIAERARITSGGEFYVAGTTDQGAYNIQCNGTGVWGAGAYVNGSDERIKEDIAPITSSLNVVEKLNPVTYRYKEHWSKDQSVQTGFIAQELLVALEDQNYVEGVVQQGGSEGYYSVAYQNIIPSLTKAIQELSTKLDEANARIAALEAK